jgi:uncharacterized membrane protein YkoI
MMGDIMGDRMKTGIQFATGLFAITALLLADTKIKMEDLPAAVQQAVKEQIKDATLVGLSKEVEKGKTTYEAETKVKGKSRDIEFDSKGAVLSIEQEVDMASIPAAAKAAIEQKTAGGTIKKVESVTSGTAVRYEAAVKTKAGKNIEIAVNADGSVHK